MMEVRYHIFYDKNEEPKSLAWDTASTNWYELMNESISNMISFAYIIPDFSRFQRRTIDYMIL